MQCRDKKQSYGKLKLNINLGAISSCFSVAFGMTYLVVYEQMMKIRSQMPFCPVIF